MGGRYGESSPAVSCRAENRKKRKPSLKTPPNSHFFSLHSHCCFSLPPPPVFCPPHTVHLVLSQYLCFLTDIFHLIPTQHCQVPPMVLTPTYLASPLLSRTCVFACHNSPALLSLITHAPAAAFRWLLFSGHHLGS